MEPGAATPTAASAASIGTDTVPDAAVDKPPAAEPDQPLAAEPEKDSVDNKNTGYETEVDRSGPKWTVLGPVQYWTEVG